MLKITHHNERYVGNRVPSIDMTASRKTDEDGNVLTNKYGQPLWFVHPAESYTAKREDVFIVQHDNGGAEKVEIMNKVEMRKTFGAKATAQALADYHKSQTDSVRRD